MDSVLQDKHYWIFDMDGTLAVAQHDFAAIKTTLGLPTSRPILEALDDLPRAAALEKMLQLDAIEFHLATSAKAQEGAFELLTQLQRNLFRMGVLTRNSLNSARKTLESCGLTGFFRDEDIVSRGCVRPKPNPDGIRKLLEQWGGRSTQAVMVGDYLFDLQCGRNAGTTTIYLDPLDERLWNGYADLSVHSLRELSGQV